MLAAYMVCFIFCLGYQYPSALKEICFIRAELLKKARQSVIFHSFVMYSSRFRMALLTTVKAAKARASGKEIKFFCAKN